MAQHIALPSTVIAWHGLPFYGARLIRSLRDVERVHILATPGPVSTQALEAELGRPLVLVAPNGRSTWSTLGIPPPDLFLHTGWAYPQFNRLARESRRQGAVTVTMVDNVWRGGLRQQLATCVFPFWHARQFDFTLVPGRLAQQYMRKLGLSDERIRIGMYGADPEVFHPGPPIGERPCDFLFVGQFTPRKGISRLIGAVEQLRLSGHQFTLTAIGSGPLERALRAARIETYPFLPADEVARHMRMAKFLVLPSTLDHWGVVVHEAACSGCGLILTDGVGSRTDLLTEANGFLVPAGSPQLLAKAMAAALTSPHEWLRRCSQRSLDLATQFGPAKWRQAIEQIWSTVIASRGHRA